MKIYKIPQNLKTIIFDIDSTLYTNDRYAFEQVDVQLRHFAEIKGVTASEIRKMIEDFRTNYSKEHDGKKIWETPLPTLVFLSKKASSGGKHF